MSKQSRGQIERATFPVKENTVILNDLVFNVRGAFVAALGMWLMNAQGCIGMMTG